MIKRYLSVREKRKARVRASIKGMLLRPRLSVFRSNRYIYAQIIDDKRGRTLVTASEFDLKDLKSDRKSKSQVPVSAVLPEKPSKVERARLVGRLLAQKALKLKIKKVVFDRGPYKYHGRVKALAEGVRKGGLKF